MLAHSSIRTYMVPYMLNRTFDSLSPALSLRRGNVAAEMCTTGPVRGMNAHSEQSAWYTAAAAAAAAPTLRLALLRQQGLICSSVRMIPSSRTSHEQSLGRDRPAPLYTSSNNDHESMPSTTKSDHDAVKQSALSSSMTGTGQSVLATAAGRFDRNYQSAYFP